jgi:3-oxoacyl-[acyl-carrier-protein] synthase II
VEKQTKKASGLSNKDWARSEAMNMTKKRVVITGMGIVSPVGNSVEAAWSSAVKGKSGIGKVTRFDVVEAGMPSHIAGEVRDFDTNLFVDVKEQKKMDIFSHYALAASAEAMEEAALPTGHYAPERMGCILGVGMGGLGYLEKAHAAFIAGGARKITPFLIPAMISNLGPGNVAIKYNLKGVNFAISSACTSSTHAIGESCRMIAAGIQDLVVTGGAESTITPIGMGGFAAMKALSTRNEEPHKASRPFDSGRDGFVIGEGAAIFVLESYDSAIARGAKILGEIVGYGVSCDANHITSPCADGSGAMACMAAALNDAGLQPSDVQYVNAHGTSTPVGDVAESQAIKGVFAEHAKNGLLVSSTKSVTGHLLGAAGAIEAAFCALAIRDGIVPPTVNLDSPDPACDLDYVPHEARKIKLTHAMSNSFGFGGTNASLILKAV